MGDTVADAGTSEAIIAAFERARLAGEEASIDAYIDRCPRDQRALLACELIRVDLELSDTLGESRSLNDYRAAAPEVFDRPDLLAQAAFEEWRVAIARGEGVTPADQIARYGLRPHDWPVPPLPTSEAGPRYPSVGEWFDGMLLERRLGSGAFSRVYAARQPRFGSRVVALKVTAAASVEPERLGRLQHTNIVPVYSAHSDRGMLGIAMPLLGEQTLADLLAQRLVGQGDVSTLMAGGERTVREGETPSPRPDQAPAGGVPPERRPLDWRRSAEAVAELAAGLAHAHERGVVHGDIKPANILMGDDGVARLLDFNLASTTDGPPAETLVVGGTLPYLAPGHLLGLVEGRGATFQCDVYSLAVVLFELLAGRRPFPDRPGDLDAVAPAMLVDRSEPPRLTGLGGVPPGLRAIVEKALRPLPTERYPSAAEFGAELRRELQDLPLRLTREPSVAGRLQKWARRRRPVLGRWLAVVCVVGMLLALLIAASAREKARDLAAGNALDTFRAELLEARLTLGAPQPEADLQRDGRRAACAAAAAVAPAGVRSRLNDGQQREVLAGLDELATLASFSGGIAEVDTVAAAFGAPATRQFSAGVAETGPPDAGPHSPESASHAFVLAVDHLHRGRFVDATRLLESAIEARPQDPALWLQYGVAAASSGDLAAGLEAFTAAGALQPRSGVIRRTKARALLDAGRYLQALSEYEAMDAAQQRSPSVQMNRALALLAGGRPTDAVEAASHAIAGGFNRPRAYLVRAKCREAAGDAAGAQADIESARRGEPVDDEDWAARGVAIERTDPEAALAEIDLGLENFPASVVLLRNRIHLLGDVLGRRAEAVEAADRLIACLPDSVAAQLSKAVCLASLGQGDEAARIADAQSARVSTPIDRLQLACVYALVSDGSPERREAAVEHAVRAVAERPELALRAAADPDLAALRSDPRYRQSLLAAKLLSDVRRSAEETSR